MANNRKSISMRSSEEFIVFFLTENNIFFFFDPGNLYESLVCYDDFEEESDTMGLQAF